MAAFWFVALEASFTFDIVVPHGIVVKGVILVYLLALNGGDSLVCHVNKMKKVS